MLRWRFPEAEGQARWGFYFGIDYRALPNAPWRSGTIYLYRRADFPPDYEGIPFLTDRPILPLAKFTVHPWDWPSLDQVLGMDLVAQTERQRETFLGYPWVTDAAISSQTVAAASGGSDAHLSGDLLCGPGRSAAPGKANRMSPFALLRMFRAHVGLSPHEYQTQQRIAQAKRP